MKTRDAYYVYIIECKGGSLYIGITYDITRRLRQHNGEIQGGALYTKFRRPVRLLYSEPHKTHRSAAQREIALKKLTHKQKEAICKDVLSLG